MLVNIKKETDSSIITSLTEKCKIKLNTKNQYVSDGILIDVVDAGIDPSDATATSNDILSGKTAYIADGSKATGTITIYDYNYIIS